MVVGVVVLGVLALGLLIGLVVVNGRARAASARVAELETSLADAERSATAAGERADAEAARAVEAEGRAKASDKRADEAERRAAEAEDRTEAAEEKVAEAIDRADQSEERALEAAEARAAAEVERDAVRTELVSALEIRLFDAAGMWAIGRRRLERLWRDRLRLLPDEPSPLDGSDRDPEAAVRLMTEASREESGVVVDLSWSLADALSPARAALLVLLAEELIAVARTSDGGELAVAGVPDGIEVTLRADPPTEAPVVAELRAAVETFGWTLDVVDGAVVVHVPTPAVAPDSGSMPAEPAPEPAPPVPEGATAF
jgi:hypothetical protein